MAAIRGTHRPRAAAVAVFGLSWPGQGKLKSVRLDRRVKRRKPHKALIVAYHELPPQVKNALGCALYLGTLVGLSGFKWGGCIAKVNVDLADSVDDWVGVAEDIYAGEIHYVALGIVPGWDCVKLGVWLVENAGKFPTDAPPVSAPSPPLGTPSSPVGSSRSR